MSQNLLTITNPATNIVMGTIPVPGSPSGVAITPDGATIYVACQSNASVAVISVASASVIKTIPVGTTPLRLAVSPNGNQVYVSNSGSASVSVIDVPSNTVIHTISVPTKPLGVAFSPDGSHAYVASYTGASLSVIDTNAGAVVRTVSNPGGANAVAVSPNGHVYVGNQGLNTVNVYDGSGNALGSISGLAGPMFMATSADGLRLYVANVNGASASVVDTTTNTVITTIKTGTMPQALTLSPDGSSVFVSNEYSNTVTQISTATNAVVTSLTKVGSYPYGLVMATPPVPTTCSYTVSGATGAFAPSGGTASVNVMTPYNCTWTATSNNPWITITSATSITGPGSITFSVAPNTTGSILSGTLTVAGQTVNVVENAASCSYSLSTASASFGSSGGSSSVTVTAPAGCGWAAASNVGWASIASGASGNGTGTVSFSVSPNTGSSALSGSLTVAGQTFTLSEAGVACSYSLSGSGSFTSSGGPGTVTVTAPSGCAWTASSNSNWASITSAASGSGNGTVSFTVSPNTGGTTLNGSLTVGGQTFSLTEAGATCTYSLSANSGSFTAAGGPGSVNVTAPSGCSWTASSNSNWASITSGSSGSGNGSVNFTISPNTGGTTLNGSLTVAGHAFSLTETGVSCTYNLSAPSQSFAFSGGTGSVNVTAPSGCTWSASSPVGWVTITGGATGSGNGTVSFSVNANNAGNSLTGTLNVAGQAFTVSEGGVSCTYQLSSNSASVGATGATGSVNVTAPVGCAWTTSTDSATWLNITAGFSGTGNGTVSYDAVANGATEPRTGNLTIGGQNFAVTEAGESFSPIFVRCGGPNYTDPSGNVWVSDNARNLSVTSASVANTTTPALYQREAFSTGTLQYQWTVPNGSFTLTLKFAEFYVMTVGSRTFNIVVNGDTLYSSFDILAHAGAMNTAYDLSIPVVVNNGQITLQLVPVTGAPKIDAIEIQ